MKLILLALTLISPIQILATDKFEMLEYSEKLENQEKEIQRLINKVEMLEHDVSKLKENNNRAKELPQETSSSHSDDVFDVSMLDEINNKVSTEAPIIEKKEIANDKHSYDLALASFKDNKLDIAEEKFTKFLKEYPKSSLVSNAYFWQGEIFFKRKDFDQAALNYLKSYKQSSKGPKASDALLKLALSLGELKKIKETCEILARLESEFPTRAAISMNRAREAKMKFGCIGN